MIKNVVPNSGQVETVNTNVVNQSVVFSQESETLNVVKIAGPSVLKSTKPGKKKKSRKRVHFIDSEPLEDNTFRERLVRFFRYLWTCTRRTVNTVLSKLHFTHCPRTLVYGVQICSDLCLNTYYLRENN